MLDLATVRNLLLIGLGVLGMAACSKAPAQSPPAAPVKTITADEVLAVVVVPKGPVEEFGEADEGFAKLPDRISALFDEDHASDPKPGAAAATDDSEDSADEDRGCGPVGKAIDLPPGNRRLWEVTSSDTYCMGSGGQQMWLVLDDPAQPPKLVLDTGTANEVKLDLKTRHHDLPDAWVVHASNCCGDSEGAYQFDGTEYRVIESHQGGSLSQLMSDPVTSSGIPGVAAPKAGCEMTEAPMDTSGGLRWVEMSCEESKYQTVWLIRRTGGDAPANVQILAKEQLLDVPAKDFPQALDNDVVLSSQTGSTAEDVVFPHTPHGPVRWHLEGETLTRIAVTSPPPKP